MFYQIAPSPDKIGYYVLDDNAPRRTNKDVLFNNLFFGSGHPSGANFANADGSVRFLSYEIELEILRPLACINDGQAIAPEDLD